MAWRCCISASCRGPSWRCVSTRSRRRSPAVAESDADYGETTVTSRTVFRGRLLHVKSDEVKLPNGKLAVREYIEHPGACMMLAFMDEQTIVLERQFRYAVRRHFIEVPAGKI